MYLSFTFSPLSLLTLSSTLFPLPPSLLRPFILILCVQCLLSTSLGCCLLKIQLGLFLNPQKLLILMAGEASKCLLFLLLLSVLAIYSSATLVGFSYDARSGEASTVTKTLSFLKLNKVSPSQIRVSVADHKVLNSLSNTGVSADLYLNETRVESLRNSIPSSISWLKTHLLTFLPHVNIESVVASSIRSELPGKNELRRVLSTLKSTHSILSSFRLSSEVKVSVAFSLKSLENLDGKHERDLRRIFQFIKKTRSFVIVEASVDGELSMGDRFVQAMIKRTTHANAVLPCSDVPMVLKVKSPAVPSGIEVAAFTDKISKSLENNTEIIGKISGLYAEVSDMEEFNQKELKREEEQLFPSSRRELVNNFHLKTTLHDVFDPPTTTFPANPVTIPLDNPTPTIVTVPSSSPVTITPANPDAAPVTVPSTTPITIPPTNPVNSPVPVTSPVTTPITVPGAQPITNPVTTYPAPSGNIPAATPFTSPVMPNSPAAAGQSWCVAKTGAMESALQAALDYACGIGGADCSMIQQGASCYNPNTLQSHASYAFNSYYQKNPTASSCDFGGTAMIVNINPSTGSCVFPSSSSSSSSPTTSLPTTTSPPSTTTSPPTTTTSSWPAISGSGTPPTVLNTSNPASATTTGYGSGSPQGTSSSVSASADLLQPFIGSIILVTSFITAKITLDI